MTQFTDRYQALGIPYPDPATMCQGQCEGTGWIPVHGPVKPRRGRVSPVDQEEDPRLLAAWRAAHTVTCSVFGRIRNFTLGIVTLDRFRLQLAIERCDGYHFVKCPDCNGTRRRA